MSATSLPDGIAPVQFMPPEVGAAEILLRCHSRLIRSFWLNKPSCSAETDTDDGDKEYDEA